MSSAAPGVRLFRILSAGALIVRAHVLRLSVCVLRWEVTDDVSIVEQLGLPVSPIRGVSIIAKGKFRN